MICPICHKYARMRIRDLMTFKRVKIYKADSALPKGTMVCVRCGAFLRYAGLTRQAWIYAGGTVFAFLLFLYFIRDIVRFVGINSVHYYFDMILYAMIAGFLQHGLKISTKLEPIELPGIRTNLENW